MAPDYSKAIVSSRRTSTDISECDLGLVEKDLRILSTQTYYRQWVHRWENIGRSTVSISRDLFSTRIQDNFEGHIDLSNIRFRYPNRSEVQVLNNYSLSVKPSTIILSPSIRRKRRRRIFLDQQVALVGSSGCGKSTTIQLLERFYEPTDGEIVSSFLQWFPSQFRRSA